jgi:protein-tyrosine phosphatase
VDRHIPFDGLHNFRDLGGYPTADGRRVRPGPPYRADSPGKLREGTRDGDRAWAEMPKTPRSCGRSRS